MSIRIIQNLVLLGLVMLFFRKNVMAVTGLFLCLFLIVHLAGNLILVFPKETAKDLYNLYSHTLAENLFIKIVSIFLYLSIALHTVYAVLITIKNKNSSGEDYLVNHNSQNSTWISRNMGLLGFTILIFIVVHMANFWVRIKLGIGSEVPLDQNGYKDVYLVTTSLFSNFYYVIFYSVLMIPLGLHIKHGLTSSLRTLGLSSKYYITLSNKVSTALSFIFVIGFAIIPILSYVRRIQ
jgi:succinate dehydrogenase / fumarate reductase cytochrome b subunit